MREAVTTIPPLPEKSRGRRTLWLLVAMFALPLLIVAGMIQLHWHPAGASHGRLISPPQALALPDTRTWRGDPFGAAQWQGKWNLVLIAQSPCDAACENQLHELRQVHASLGKEIGRVQRILLATGQASDASLASVQAQYPDLIILTGPDAGQLAAPFIASAPASPLFLVDPMGNLMMHYPPGREARGLRKDLMRLLTYSWVG